MNLIARLKKLNSERSQGIWIPWFVTTAPQRNPLDEMHPLIHGAAPPHELGDHNPDAVNKATKDAEFIALSANAMDKLLAVATWAQYFIKLAYHNQDCSHILEGKCDCGFDDLTLALAALDAEVGSE